MVLVAPPDPENGGARERILYDRRRELGDFVGFLNTECGTSVAAAAIAPKNFQPPNKQPGAGRGGEEVDPVLQCVLLMV